MKKDVRLFIKGTHISANPQVNEEEPFENADEIFTQTSGIYHAKDGKRKTCIAAGSSLVSYLTRFFSESVLLLLLLLWEKAKKKHWK